MELKVGWAYAAGNHEPGGKFWVDGEGPKYRGALREVRLSEPGRRSERVARIPVWACDHAHYTRWSAEQCAEVELRVRKNQGDAEARRMLWPPLRIRAEGQPYRCTGPQCTFTTEDWPTMQVHWATHASGRTDG